MEERFTAQVAVTQARCTREVQTKRTSCMAGMASVSDSQVV